MRRRLLRHAQRVGGGLEPPHHGVEAGVAEREDFSLGGKNDHRHLSAAEDGELAGLLEDSGPAFGERDLPARVVVDHLDGDLLPPSRLLLLYEDLFAVHFFFFWSGMEILPKVGVFKKVIIAYLWLYNMICKGKGIILVL